MGVFVDQQQLGLARQGAVQVELHQLPATIFDRLARQHLQPGQQGLGFLAAVGLDQADDHLDALGMAPTAGGQHLVGLADPRGHAEVNLEPTSPLTLGFGQQRVWIGTERLIRRHDALG